MAKYGARYIKFAPFAASNPEPDNAYPNYGTAVDMSKLVKVSDNPNVAEGKLHGDDELAEYASEFTEADIDVEVTEVSNAMGAAILGATLGTDGDLEQGGDDAAPYGGLGFITCKVINGVKGYAGVYYPKVKAQIQGEEYETKGDSINFVTGKLRFKATQAANGEWKVTSAVKATFAAAKTWIDGKLGG